MSRRITLSSSELSSLLLRLTPTLALAGCQIFAPLPDIETNQGGGGSSTTSVTSAGSSSSTGGGGSTSDGGSPATDPCGSPACSSYCTGIEATCTNTLQYASTDQCCAVCGTLGEAAAACRPVPPVDGPKGCSDGGPLGPTNAGDECVVGCRALCVLLVAYCSVPNVDECVSACDGGDTGGDFDLCRKAPDHSAVCALQDVLLASVSNGQARDKACEDAFDGKCRECDGGGG